MKVLVTGATGFVGQALVEHLNEHEHSVLAVSRSISKKLSTTIKQIAVGDIAENVDYESALCGIDVVVHCAARVHVMKDKSVDPLAEFRRVNTDATLKLAKQAAKAGVKRFIFLSTIKVNGGSTSPGKTFSEKDICNPIDPYGLSKYEAEQGLLRIAEETEMEVVIIRPPLVYGPGVKGNFASMTRWVSRGIPLPLGAVKNKRSLLALDNLIHFIICCMHHPKAANQVFLLSDGDDVSTPALIQKLAYSQGVSARLLSIPVSWMRLVFSLMRKRDIADRLFGSLQVDSRKAREYLGWEPVVTMDEQLRAMARK